jgi:hypothetical protein
MSVPLIVTLAVAGWLLAVGACVAIFVSAARSDRTPYAYYEGSDDLEAVPAQARQ